MTAISGRGAMDGSTVESTRSVVGPLAALAICTLLPSLGLSSVNVALPELATSFDAPFAAVQWVVIAYLLAMTALVVGAGRLGDQHGRRTLLISGTLVFAAASMGCALAPSLWVLVAGRAAQGIGAAAMVALAMALVRDCVPAAHTGRAMGMLGTMSAVGTALGPSVGGFLVAAFGWQAIFVVNVPLAILATWLVARHIPTDTRNGSTVARFDVAGTILLTVALAAYAGAMTTGRGGFGPFEVGLLIFAAAGSIGFIAVERRVVAPLVPPATLSDRSLVAALLASALVATVMMATLIVGPFFLGHGLGLAPAAIGLVMSIGPASSAVSGLVAGRIVDRAGSRPSALAGLVAVATGSTGLAVLPTLLGLAGYVGSILLLTAGYALFQAANNTAVMSTVEPARRGVVSGLANLARNLGLVTGASAMGAVFAAAAGTPDFATASHEAVEGAMAITFALATALALLAATLLWILGKVERGGT